MTTVMLITLNKQPALYPRNSLFGLDMQAMKQRLCKIGPLDFFHNHVSGFSHSKLL